MGADQGSLLDLLLRGDIPFAIDDVAPLSKSLRVPSFVDLARHLAEGAIEALGVPSDALPVTHAEIVSALFLHVSQVAALRRFDLLPPENATWGDVRKILGRLISLREIARRTVSSPRRTMDRLAGQGLLPEVSEDVPGGRRLLLWNRRMLEPQLDALR